MVLVVDTDVPDSAVAADVLVLRRAPGALEVDPIGSTEIPPLHETLDELIAALLRWRGMLSQGFVVTGESMPVPGIWMTHFVRGTG